MTTKCIKAKEYMYLTFLVLETHTHMYMYQHVHMCTVYSIIHVGELRVLVNIANTLVLHMSKLSS